MARDYALRTVWIEAVTAQDPARARAAMDLLQGMRTSSDSILPMWEGSQTVVSWAFAGNLRRAQEELDSWLARTPEGTRDREFEAAVWWAQWGLALQGGRPEEALAKVEALQQEWTPCAIGRCWGHYEKGLALEALGRKEEAIAEYRLHLEGLPSSEVFFAPTATPDVLEHLATLQEELGDRAGAASTWRRFAESWSDADPDQQPRVRRARERADALGG